MTNSRWQMNRIGLLDFWYYDEEEFSFLDGRMLLRGSNGSGKSVTMQSFIPLILDISSSLLMPLTLNLIFVVSPALSSVDGEPN